MHPVVFNGSYLSLRATGIGNYILNLWRGWRRLGLPVRGYLPPEYANEGSGEIVRVRGHLARLAWTQFVLPTLVRPGELLFNPVPEGPLLGNFVQIAVAHDVIPLVYPELFPRKVGYFRTLVPASLHRAAHVVCDSEQTRADLRRFYDLDPERLSVIYLACDRERFFPAPPAPDCLARHGLEAQHYFFYVGAHEPHKNLGRLLEGFAAVARSWEGVLAIGGAADERYTPALKAQAERLGIGGRVVWLDFLSATDLPMLYRGARAFVFVSLYEGFGLPVVEAMSCGVPVIASANGALAEVAGEGALLVDPEDSQSIAGGLARMLDPATHQEYRTRALIRAEAFSLERTATSTWEVIQKVAADSLGR